MKYLGLEASRVVNKIFRKYPSFKKHARFDNWVKIELKNTHKNCGECFEKADSHPYLKHYYSLIELMVNCEYLLKVFKGFRND